MICKTVKVRKDHRCDMCAGIIRKGQLCEYSSGRYPVFDENDDQCGVEYSKGYSHLEPCRGLLLAASSLKKAIQECSRGLHEYEEEYVLDHYVDCHAVGVGTGEYFCVNCHKKRENHEK
jgi:hypothetical protein